jgi:hypothetical protein
MVLLLRAMFEDLLTKYSISLTKKMWAENRIIVFFYKYSKRIHRFKRSFRCNPRKSPNLFAKIMQREKLNKGKISANIPAEPKKSKNSVWVAVGLDVLGAAAIGLGIYYNAKSSDYHRESQALLNDRSYKQEQYQEKKAAFDAKYKKMQNAETARNIFYATGSALLLGGISVHIWF